MDKEKENEKQPGYLSRISNKIIFFLESGFSKLGELIATRPWITIFICCTIVAITATGFVRFTETTESTSLWVPYNVAVRDYYEWVSDKYPTTSRYVIMIFVANNVLSPSAIQAMNTVYQNSLTLATSSGQNFSTLCLASGSNCLVRSVLELWSYDDTTIQGLSASDITTQINTVTTSPMYYNDYDVTTQVGGRTYTGSNITSAAAASITWILNGNNETESMEWESLAINLALAGQSGVTIYVYASRSLSDLASKAIQADTTLLSAGYVLLIMFVSLVLGRFNCIEQRVGLAFCGLLVIGLSLCFSFSLSSAAGWEYGPVHSILPFLLLGIGVDDMFVIVAALSAMSEKERQSDVKERISIMLKHAGVSITVTSLTDIVAFGIGATTVLPALKSFCIFACIGVVALYCLSATFFVACITLDERRKDAGRNACICCYKHKADYRPSNCSQKDRIPIFLSKVYSPLLLKTPLKVIVVIITLTLLGVNIWGLLNLKQDSDFTWFLPTDSYGYQYFQISYQYFPGSGSTAAVYCKNIDYFNSKSKFDQLYSNLTTSSYVSSGTVDSWFQSYTDYLSTTTDASVQAQLDSNKYPVNESSFVSILYDYVTTVSSGLRHSAELKFISSNTDIDASYISFTHVTFDDSASEIQAMDSTQNLISSIFTNSECFAYGRSYLNWSTNKVIREELYRNLGLAAACVFVVTLILVANLWTSLMVFTCVVGTLIDVCGMMYFWGLTIDTVTCILLILALGLAVDYSAHVGHCFMTLTGSRDDRAKQTLVEVGAPVFSGGFSTFLAFVLLAGSNSYVFTTFFKIFFLVVLFGLFHGLVYLPVILSWLGPAPYLTADDRYNHKDKPNEVKISPHGKDNARFEQENPVRSPSPPHYEEVVKRQTSSTGNRNILPTDATAAPLTPIQT